MYLWGRWLSSWRTQYLNNDSHMLCIISPNFPTTIFGQFSYGKKANPVMWCLYIVHIYFLLYALILVNSVKRLKMYFNRIGGSSEERDSLAVLIMKKNHWGFPTFLNTRKGRGDRTLNHVSCRNGSASDKVSIFVT